MQGLAALYGVVRRCTLHGVQCAAHLCCAATHLEMAGALENNPCHGALWGCRRLDHGACLAGAVHRGVDKGAINSPEIVFLLSFPGALARAGVWVVQHAAHEANTIAGALQYGRVGRVGGGGVRVQRSRMPEGRIALRSGHTGALQHWQTTSS